MERKTYFDMKFKEWCVEARTDEGVSIAAWGKDKEEATKRFEEQLRSLNLEEQ